MRGDILFYPASSILSDRIITAVTDGPFVHVAVDMGDGTEISAHSEDGIQRRPLSLSGLTAGPMRGFDVELGMAWLVRQVGSKYGYGMVLNAGLKKFGIPWRVYMVGRYDCSVLVVHYLEHCGYTFLDDDESISPNDLARTFGILKK